MKEAQALHSGDFAHVAHAVVAGIDSGPNRAPQNGQPFAKDGWHDEQVAGHDR